MMTESIFVCLFIMMVSTPITVFLCVKFGTYAFFLARARFLEDFPNQGVLKDGNEIAARASGKANGVRQEEGGEKAG